MLNFIDNAGGDLFCILHGQENETPIKEVSYTITLADQISPTFQSSQLGCLKE